MPKTITDPFYLGGISALEAFEIQLEQDRDRIEADTQPPVDLILELLRATVEGVREMAARAPRR